MATFSKSMLNEIFRALVEAHIEPQMSQIKHPSYATMKIIHLPTQSYFDIEADSHSIGSFFLVSQVGNEWQSIHGEGHSWSKVIQAVRDWAGRVVEWADTPDLWSESAGWRVFADADSQGDDNSPFTRQERELIFAQLAAMGEAVKRASQLTSAQEARLDERLKVIGEASGRMGRKDWRLLLLGGIFSLVLADAFPPETARHLLELAGRSLGSLFAIGAPMIGRILGG
ncbi:hypothetical protein [Dactylosporangium sp. CA-139066]|uniref:hypothetical protein n=1 Tax=Dactylosporangium sp. CA-139066 TaxID=3239930 RepID=UPI003D93E79E